jgi:hypothetical protein
MIFRGGKYRKINPMKYPGFVKRGAQVINIRMFGTWLNLDPKCTN